MSATMIYLLVIAALILAGGLAGHGRMARRLAARETSREMHISAPTRAAKSVATLGTLGWWLALLVPSTFLGLCIAAGGPALAASILLDRAEMLADWPMRIFYALWFEERQL